MTAKKQLTVVYGFLWAFIGLSATAAVLIGGAYLITDGAVGELPTLPMLMLAGALFAESFLRAKIKAVDNAR
jgi:hypothetical protein